MSHPPSSPGDADGLKEPITDDADAVRRHYEGDATEAERVAKVSALLDGLGQGGDAAQKLAAVDHFHVRGRAATVELARLAELKPGMAVLDAGSGLGGPSRTLASDFGCNVIGVDLTPSFVTIAKLIAERTQLADRVSYQVGDLLALGFPDASFDVVWAEHVVMNIAERDRLYAGFARVLKPGGVLAFYDVVAAEDGGALLYPNPWAETPKTSFVLTAAATRVALERAGFGVEVLHDVSAQAIAWFAEFRPAPGAPGLAAVMGPRFGEMAMTLARNVREGRARLTMGVARKEQRP